MRSVRPSSHAPGSEPTLTFDELRAALVELQPTLLAPEGFTAVFGNELWLWSWTTEMLIGFPWPESPRRYIEMDELGGGPGYLLRLAIWTALADSRPPVAMDKEAWKEMVQKKAEDERNTREMVSNHSSILAYLSFPLLEGVTKLRCNDYVDLNGGVRQPFKAETRQYDPASPRKNRVSSLKDLLWLLYDHVANEDEKRALQSVRDSIYDATHTDAFDQIYAWRNSQAHGGDSLHAIGYTVYNLALLIGLHGIEDRYEAIRDDHQDFLAEQIRGAFGREPHHIAWHYYPPYWREIPPGLAYSLQASSPVFRSCHRPVAVQVAARSCFPQLRKVVVRS